MRTRNKLHNNWCGESELPTTKEHKSLAWLNVTYCILRARARGNGRKFYGDTMSTSFSLLIYIVCRELKQTTKSTKSMCNYGKLFYQWKGGNYKYYYERNQVWIEIKSLYIQQSQGERPFSPSFFIRLRVPIHMYTEERMNADNQLIRFKRRKVKIQTCFSFLSLLLLSHKGTLRWESSERKKRNRFLRDSFTPRINTTTSIPDARKRGERLTLSLTDNQPPQRRKSAEHRFLSISPTYFSLHRSWRTYFHCLHTQQRRGVAQ